MCEPPLVEIAGQGFAAGHRGEVQGATYHTDDVLHVDVYLSDHQPSMGGTAPIVPETLLTFFHICTEDNMTTDVKTLQQLVESSKGASPLDWSTISHTHAAVAAAAAQNTNSDLKEDIALTVNLIQQLQQLPQAAEVSPMEWSTISHTH